MWKNFWTTIIFTMRLMSNVTIRKLHCWLRLVPGVWFGQVSLWRHVASYQYTLADRGRHCIGTLSVFWFASPGRIVISSRSFPKFSIVFQKPLLQADSWSSLESLDRRYQQSKLLIDIMFSFFVVRICCLFSSLQKAILCGALIVQGVKKADQIKINTYNTFF